MSQANMHLSELVQHAMQIRSPAIFILLLSCLGIIIWQRRSLWVKSSLPQPKPEAPKSPVTQCIVPLEGFRWEHVPPKKIRPFKPKYHLTMAITQSSVSEFIEMDRNYHRKIMDRRQTLSQSPEIATGANQYVGPAVDELYTWLLGTYLPTRFPSMFRRNQTTDGKGSITNLVTEESIPLEPSESPLETLKTLGSHLDEDFLFLLPSPDGDGYTLQGYVVCCPNGFNTKEKLDMKLRDIHGPVPGYKAKIEKSMDRFFDRIETGTYVRRANWSISLDSQLFSPSGRHLYVGQEIPTDENIDIAQTYVRTELQTLHRLPQTKALVFSFKTYLYSLSEIKAEGSGPDLAAAIDGLKTGSVPEMHIYKRGVVWGDKVKEYLLSDE